MLRISTTTAGVLLLALLASVTLPKSYACDYGAALVVWDVIDDATIDYSAFPVGWAGVLSDAVEEATGCSMTFGNPNDRRQLELNVPFQPVSSHSFRGTTMIDDNNNNKEDIEETNEEDDEHRLLQANSPWQKWCVFMEHYCDFGCVSEIVCDLFNNNNNEPPCPPQNPNCRRSLTTETFEDSPFPQNEIDEFDEMLENNDGRHLGSIFDGSNAAEILWLHMHMLYDGDAFPSFLKSGWVQIHLFAVPSVP